MSGAAKPWRRALLATLGALTVSAQVTPAAAQDTRYPPEPVDVDAKREAYSDFWERAAHPERSRYDERIRLALEYIRRNDEDGLAAALDKLDEAIELSPDVPVAYWLKATLYEQEEQWRACADSYAKVVARDATYAPRLRVLDRRASQAAVDFGLAICHAQLGEYEVAITHLKRITKRAAWNDGRVFWRLGEAYMALGQLRNAIDVLQLATRKLSRRAVPFYALAVALDRDEQNERAYKAFQKGWANDRSLHSLEAPSSRFTPSEDRYYYLGLANSLRGNTEWALTYFRQYLQVASPGPWRRRALDHVRDLTTETLPCDCNLDISGAELKREVVMAEIQKHRLALQQCVVTTPGLLIEVSITVLGRMKPRARQAARRSIRRGTRAGVKASALYSFSTTPEQTDRARQCVEAVAENIAIKAPEGANQYTIVRFPVVAPPTAADAAP